MTVPSSRNYYAKGFGLPTDLVGAKRHLKDNPSLLGDKMFYIGLYSSVMDNDLVWVKMIVEQGKTHLPSERRKGMLSFSGWLQSAIATEHDQMIEYLLCELLDHGIYEDNFEELLVSSVNHSEYKVLDALLAYNTEQLDVTEAYFQACCAATDYNDCLMYSKILPLVAHKDWVELEEYLDERSLTKEQHLLEEHQCWIQRKNLQQNVSGGSDDTPRKL